MPCLAGPRLVNGVSAAGAESPVPDGFGDGEGDGRADREAARCPGSDAAGWASAVPAQPDSAATAITGPSSQPPGSQPRIRADRLSPIALTPSL